MEISVKRNDGKLALLSFFISMVILLVSCKDENSAPTGLDGCKDIRINIDNGEFASRAGYSCTNDTSKIFLIRGKTIMQLGSTDSLEINFIAIHSDSLYERNFKTAVTCDTLEISDYVLFLTPTDEIIRGSVRKSSFVLYYNVRNCNGAVELYGLR